MITRTRTRALTLITRAAFFALALVAALPRIARAQDAEPTQPAPRRIFGMGTAFGGGFSGADSGAGPALLLPTLELQFFTVKDISIDVTVPITNMVLVSEAVKGFVFTTDTFVNFNLGDGAVRFVIGPGLGFTAASLQRGGMGAIRLPAEAGLEVLTAGRGFGFKLLARPWAEYAFGDGVKETVGGGVLGVLAFSSYVTTP